MTVCADVKCYYCGHISGKLTGEMGRPFRRDAFEPVQAHRDKVLRVGEKLRCLRCGGPVFLDDIQYIRRPSKAPADLARRRRSAREPVRKAS